MSHAPADGLSFGAFGQRLADLDLDFATTSRPHLVTRLLACCAVSEHAEAPSPNVLWAMTVGARVAGLLRILERTGLSTLPLTLACRHPACRQPMEVDLPLDELVARHRTATQHAALPVTIDGVTIRLRRPTGDDQRRWHEQSFDDEQAARNAIIRTLIIEPTSLFTDGPIPEAAAEAIGQALQDVDVLVSLGLTIRCPSCEDERTYAIDVQEIALQHLRHVQHRLLRDIHRLACRYHWSEAQIVALPPWRRARYLTMLAHAEEE